MKIEIAKAERMSQSGSSLLRLIQNNNMPILDLFVRESVQNSLDAGIDGMDYVNLQFLTGTFVSSAFSSIYGMIMVVPVSSPLYRLIPNSSSTF